MYLVFSVEAEIPVPHGRPGRQALQLQGVAEGRWSGLWLASARPAKAERLRSEKPSLIIYAIIGLHYNTYWSDYRVAVAPT
jgi:hypothetical protein